MCYPSKIHKLSNTFYLMLTSKSKFSMNQHSKSKCRLMMMKNKKINNNPKKWSSKLKRMLRSKIQPHPKSKKKQINLFLKNKRHLKLKSQNKRKKKSSLKHDQSSKKRSKLNLLSCINFSHIMKVQLITPLQVIIVRSLIRSLWKNPLT